jgi:ketosteroid isomerase-like protein
MKRNCAVLLALVTAVALVGSVSLVRAQSSANADVAAITALENGFVKADLANDKAYFQKTIADDATAGGATGVWYTKAMFMKMMDDPKNNKTNHEEISELKVRLYGNTAIATYKDKYDGVEEGKPVARTVIATDTFVKLNGEWKFVAGHASVAK